MPRTREELDELVEHMLQQGQQRFDSLGEGQRIGRCPAAVARRMIEHLPREEKYDTVRFQLAFASMFEPAQYWHQTSTFLAQTFEPVDTEWKQHINHIYLDLE
jgi:hypothetical protein